MGRQESSVSTVRGLRPIACVVNVTSRKMPRGKVVKDESLLTSAGESRPLEYKMKL